MAEDDPTDANQPKGKAARRGPSQALTTLLKSPPFLTIAADTPVDGSLDKDSFALATRLGPLYDIIRHPATGTPLAAAVTGPWGSGKTSAMRWLDRQLRDWTKNVKAGQVRTEDKTTTLVSVKTVWFYPWKYSAREDVWRGLIAEVIIACLKESPDDMNTFISEMKDFAGFLGKTAWTVVSGLKLSAGNSANKVELEPLKDLDKVTVDYLKPEAQFLNEFEATLERWVKKWLSGNARLVIFIDDLDRCLPEVALEVLEALKLYLNMDKMIFVIGVDRDVVNQMIIKHYEGHGVEEIKAREYLDKMFQVDVRVRHTDAQARDFLADLLAGNEAWARLQAEPSEQRKAIIQDAIARLAGESPRKIKRLVNNSLISGAGARYRDATLDDAVQGAADKNQDQADHIPDDPDLAFLQGMQFDLITWILEHDLGGSQGRLAKARTREFFKAWSDAVIDLGINREIVQSTDGGNKTLRLTDDQARELQRRVDTRERQAENFNPIESPSSETDDTDTGEIYRRPIWKLGDRGADLLEGLELHPAIHDLLTRYPGTFIRRALAHSVLADLMQIPFSEDVAEDLAADIDTGNNAALEAALQDALDQADGDTLEEKRRNVRELGLNDLDLADIALLARLENLQNLDLGNTGISDIIPLASLENLQNLDLGNTGVSDITPLANLKILQYLDLEYVGVNDIAPLANLKNLRELYLSHTGVSDITPLARLENLRELYLDNTGVSDITPLARLENLRELYLQNTGVSDTTLLANLKNLHGLDLRYTGVSDIAPLARLENLRSLYLQNTDVNDITPLANLKNLRVLYLDNTGVSDIAPLARLYYLQSLDLQHTDISDIAPLAHLKNLERFNLENTGVSEIAPLARLENLVSLNLRCTSVSDIAPLSCLENLEYLYLTKGQINQDRIDALQQMLPDLKITIVESNEDGDA